MTPMRWRTNRGRDGVPVDPDHSDCAVEFLWHGVLLALGAPANFLAAGLEHGRTIPLTERGQLQIFAT
jgi:hypothetical protein